VPIILGTLVTLSNLSSKVARQGVGHRFLASEQRKCTIEDLGTVEAITKPRCKQLMDHSITIGYYWYNIATILGALWFGHD
jgi:hypothetical protein